MKFKTNIKELQEYGITKISQIYDNSDIDNIISLIDTEAKRHNIDLWSKLSCNIEEEVWKELRKKLIMVSIRYHKKNISLFF